MLSLCWFSGHAKVDGNEKADLTPRAATQEGSLPERKLSPLKLIALKESTTKLSPETEKCQQGLESSSKALIMRFLESILRFCMMDCAEAKLQSSVSPVRERIME